MNKGQKELSKLNEEQNRFIKERLNAATNKSEEWENIKKAPELMKDGEPMLSVSLSAAKDELINLGLLAPSKDKFDFVSVEEYQHLVDEQEKLAPKDRDTRMNSAGYCPPPTEGIFVNVKDFNTKASNERKELLSRANQVASENRKSAPPYVYIHGIAMPWDSLKVLMEANGFELQGNKFVDLCRNETEQWEESKEVITYDLDRIREISDDNKRMTVTLSDRARTMFKKHTDLLIAKELNSSARTSVLFESIFMIGLITAEKMRDEGALKFSVSMKDGRKIKRVEF